MTAIRTPVHVIRIVRTFVHIQTRFLIVTVQLVARRARALESAENVATMITAMRQCGALVNVHTVAGVSIVAQTVCAMFCGDMLVHFEDIVVGRWLMWRLGTTIRSDGVDATMCTTLANLRILTLVDVCTNV